MPEYERDHVEPDEAEEGADLGTGPEPIEEQWDVEERKDDRRPERDGLDGAKEIGACDGVEGDRTHGRITGVEGNARMTVRFYGPYRQIRSRRFTTFQTFHDVR